MDESKPAAALFRPEPPPQNGSPINLKHLTLLIMLHQMKRIPRAIFIALLVTIGVTSAAHVGFAAFEFQDTTLSSPEIGGLIPEGSATINQNAQPHAPGRLTLQVHNVALANGTRLDVTLDQKPGGTITIQGRTGTMTAALPLQAGRLSSLIVTSGETIVLIGKTPWVVPWPTTP